MKRTSIARHISNGWWAASILALLLAIGVMGFIFVFVLARGLPALRPSVFVTVTNGIAGGLANAISGTLLLVALGVVLVMVVGISTALWIVEFAQPGTRAFVRFCIDILAGVPSIVVGYFLYVALVEDLGWGFSLIAGAFALAIIMLPYVVRSADLALTAVPTTLREGAAALGARPATVLLTVSMPWAAPGILTGVLVATGIALGETAPLIYTAGWSNYMPSLAPTHSPVGYLTYVVWSFISQPFSEAHELAYAAAALLMLFIFVTNLVSRVALEAWSAKRA
ncbi:MAG TPA: phosphate ABC transporter permease PstA [Candidatus Baltobacteraceae bacterium]|jgi:phosphate transport system permease protein|nr:phosphate ABC transporter permease PstA [Candidatus Baltobacteraceae bacterium]